jgi:hypothetical protein
LTLTRQGNTELRRENALLTKRIDSVLDCNQKMEGQMKAQMAYLSQVNAAHDAKMDKLMRIIQALNKKLGVDNNSDDENNEGSSYLSEARTTAARK